MKEILVFTVVLILVCLMIGPTDAQAIGIGFYLEGGGGSGKMTREDVGGDVDVDIDASHGGIGFSLDTAVADESVFNYRLSVGYEGFTLDPEGSPDNIDLDAIVAINDFGFAIVKQQKLRVWAGPEVKFGYYMGDNNDTLGISDITYASIGAGPVVGVNIGLTKLIFIVVKASYVYSYFSGELEDDAGDSHDIHGTYGEGVLSAGMLFNLSR